MTDYPFVIQPVSEEDGGGYLCVFPDLPGCMSDGETPQEALDNGLDALNAWLEVQQDREVVIPEPFSSRVEFDAKEKSLINALRELINYHEYAETRIPELEKALEIALQSISSDWRSTAPALSHAAMTARKAIAKH